jgi:MerR family copper efflux transcriptional regulator
MARLTLLNTSPVPGAPTSSTSSASVAPSAAVAPRTLRIGDLAKRSGKTQRALRLYEELGLLTPSERTSGGFRLYGVEAIARVEWIGKLQELGFTLEQIQHLVATISHERVPKDAMAQVRGLFLQKLDDVAAQIARLSQLQRELMSSLAYLESCGGCQTHPEDGRSGAACCSGCTTHHDEPAPPLLAQTTKTAALL